MKTVCITGIGKGIGEALAKKFLAEGWNVIGTSTTGEVVFEDKNLEVVQLDLTVSKSIADCVQSISNISKTIDVLINNAGVLHDEDETEVITDRLRSTLEVNLIGTVDFTERMLRYVREHVINISSTAGSLELTGKHGHHIGYYPAYKISKAALNMYTRTLAGRLAAQNILVSSVHPGWVKTSMGGDEADITVEEAAQDIFNFVQSKPSTGGFWYKGERLPW